MKTQLTVSKTLSVPAIAILIAALGCSSKTKVEGTTYEDNGGVVKIEFKSGGKAYVSTGPATNECTFAQSDRRVTLTCAGDKTLFKVDDDGSLNGPPGGFITRLTKKQ